MREEKNAEKRKIGEISVCSVSLAKFGKRIYTAKQMNYHITTFGCQMNVHESEKLAGILFSMGYREAEKQEDADVIIFNTCAIREGAEDRALGNIGALKQLKMKDKSKIIAVCGCMSQQKEVAEKLYKTFPFLDIVFGTHNLTDFRRLLAKRKEGKRVLEIQGEFQGGEEPSPKRSGEANAWVNVIYGCNNFCSYCIVPYVRGRERSREKEKILAEIRGIVQEYTLASGRNKQNTPSVERPFTITLLGQNVNSYGKGLYKHYDFADLLADICHMDGDFNVTFMTSHPKDISDKLLETMAHEDKILKELHLPVQSGSNAILNSMNRNYTKESYLKIIQTARKLMPSIRLTTDIIVGFPGETEDDFHQTLDLVKEVKFNGLFGFMYSPRPNTPAALFENQIDDKIKNQRVNLLLNLQKQMEKGN